MPQESVPISSGPPYLAQSSEPTDTAVIWIDTSDDERLKYHDGNGWEPLLAASDYTPNVSAGYITEGADGVSLWDGDTGTGPSKSTGGTFSVAIVAPGVTPTDTTDTVQEDSEFPLSLDGVRFYWTEDDVDGDITYTIDVLDSNGDSTEVVSSSDLGTDTEGEYKSHTFAPQTVSGVRVAITQDSFQSSTTYEITEVQPHRKAVGRHRHE